MKMEDPVELLGRGFDALIPAYKEMQHTNSKELLMIAAGLKSYKDLLTDIPDLEKGGVHEYAKKHGLSRAKELGIHIALLDAHVSNNYDVKNQTKKVADLVLGEAQESDNPNAIHFPDLIPAIDLLTSHPENLPESVLDKRNVHAFEVKKSNPTSVSCAKAIIFGGLLWKDLNRQQRVLMLEDFLNVSVATTEYINRDKGVDPRVNVNNGIASVVNHGLFQQLIPIVNANGGTLDEIVDAVIDLADRRIDKKRGPSNSFPDKSPKEVVLQNLDFALQQTVIPSATGNKDYTNPNKSIEKVKGKIASLNTLVSS